MHVHVQHVAGMPFLLQGPWSVYPMYLRGEERGCMTGCPGFAPNQQHVINLDAYLYVLSCVNSIVGGLLLFQEANKTTNNKRAPSGR
jgi:hypothetical protein